MMVSHIVREPERWSLLAQEDWWKHFLEIAFHIHPEDATEQDKAMMMEICQKYDITPTSFDRDHLIAASSSKLEKKQLLTKMISLYSDAYFKVGTLDTAQIVAEQEVPVFQYR